MWSLTCVAALCSLLIVSAHGSAAEGDSGEHILHRIKRQEKETETNTQTKMAVMASSLVSLLSFSSRILLKRLRNPRSLLRKVSNGHSSSFKLRKYSSFSRNIPQLSDQTTIIFDVESALMKSPSLFPYFMLVAFEAGGLLRALLLLLLYPLICLFNEEMKLKIMVMVCFCGIKQAGFRAGRAVLPKFLLEDVGLEGFEMLNLRRSGGRKVGVSNLPRVMVEGFLKEYLEIDVVVGRELKVFHGYYLGLMEEKISGRPALEQVLGEERLVAFDDDIVGFGSFHKLLDHQLFSCCKEMYMVTEAEKRSWTTLPKDMYPKPLIFHDGRLALKPTPVAIIAVFMWLPFGLLLAMTRALVGYFLPYKLAIPLLAFTGLRLELTMPKYPNSSEAPTLKSKGVLYVCNHRTLMDPLYLSAILGKPITAVTYSLSKVSEILAPIKTVRLTRDKKQDAKIVEKLLSQGDLVICPEGTTCREPYLLRFSPLFAEMGDEIVPVAMDTDVSMFYGTTASGLKFLDPIFFLMNPSPVYYVKLLGKVTGTSGCEEGGHEARLRVANNVQKEIGKALGFECTRLTRKDKYLILAGNEGIVNSGNKL